mgnify:CR=1 FL=1
MYKRNKPLSARGREEDSYSQSKDLFDKECQERYVKRITPNLYDSLDIQPESLNNADTNKYLDRLVEESMEAEEAESRECARLKSHFIWSEQKISEQEDYINQIQEALYKESKRNEELSDKCELLQRKLEGTKEQLRDVEYMLDCTENQLDKAEKDKKKLRKTIKKNGLNKKRNNLEINRENVFRKK